MANKTWYSLKINDVLSLGYIDVGGNEFDAKVVAYFTRKSLDGPIEMVDMEINDIAIVLRGEGEYAHLDAIVRLDQDSFYRNKSLEKALVQVLEKKAMEMAKNTIDTRWELEEEF